MENMEEMSQQQIFKNEKQNTSYDIHVQSSM